MFYHGSSINRKIDRTLWVEQHQIDKGVKNQRLKLTLTVFFSWRFLSNLRTGLSKGTMCRNPRIQRWKRFDLKFPLNDLNILHNQIYPNLAFLDGSDNSAICWPINAYACRPHEAPRFPGPALWAEEPQNRFALCSHPWSSCRNVPGRLAVHWQTQDSSLKKISIAIAHQHVHIGIVQPCTFCCLPNVWNMFKSFQTPLFQKPLDFENKSSLSMAITSLIALLGLQFQWIKWIHTHIIYIYNEL